MKHNGEIRHSTPWAIAAAAVLLATGAAAIGQQPANKTLVRVEGINPAPAIVGPIAERYSKTRAGVTVQVKQTLGGPPSCATALAEGKADLVVLYGAPDVLSHHYLKGRDIGRLKDVFKKDEVRTHVLGWRAMAVVVNPKSKLNEISDATVRQIVLSFSNTKNSDPLKSRGIRYMAEGYGCSMEMRRLILGEDKFLVSGSMVGSSTRTKMLEQAAADPKLMAFMALDEKLSSSGVKILPVRFDGGPPVAPTINSVLSGEYRYRICMLLAIHPKASEAARAFAQELLGTEFARELEEHDYYWISRESKWQAAPATESIWPALAAETQRLEISGAAAVLPLQMMSKHFLLAGPNEQQAYELAVQDGIAADKRLKLVDRAELTRVLTERKLALEGSGPQPDRPLIAADVIVLSRVVTEATKPYLLVQAYHSASGSCIGWLKLPIDPAKPTAFSVPLSQRVGQWWPGVLRNLAAAQTRPAWTVTGRQAASASDDASADKVRAAVRRELAGDERLFLAEFSPLADTQREVLMRLMGLTRPSGGFAAQYVVDVMPGESGKASLRILDGTTLRVLDQVVLAGNDPVGQAEVWLTSQVQRFIKPTALVTANPAEVQARRRQAQLELERGLELAKQYAAFREQAEKRLAAKGIQVGLPLEDKQELARLASLRDSCYDRAAQLDPANEEAAFHSALARADYYTPYAEKVAAVDAIDRFLQNFPRSKHCGEMLGKAFYLNYMLAGSLGNLLKEGTSGAPPPGIDVKKAARQHRLACLRSITGLLDRQLRWGYDSHAQGPAGMSRFFASGLEQFMAFQPGKEELEDLVSEYGRVVDDHPADAMSSDFMRLRILAVNRDKEGYQRLLAEMRSRRPDPKDAYWKLAHEDLQKDQLLLQGKVTK